MATAQWTKDARGTRDSLGDWVLQLGAMTGAAVGAVTGVSLADDLHSGPYAAALLGTAGTILGSASCALAGKYLLLPLWAAMLGLPASKRE